MEELGVAAALTAEEEAEDVFDVSPHGGLEVGGVIAGNLWYGLGQDELQISLLAGSVSCGSSIPEAMSICCL